MTSPPEDLTRLDEITRRVREIEAERETLLAEARDLLLVQLKAGAGSTTLSRRAPYSHAWIRALARANGIEATGRGKRKTEPKSP